MSIGNKAFENLLRMIESDSIKVVLDEFSKHTFTLDRLDVLFEKANDFNRLDIVKHLVEEGLRSSVLVLYKYRITVNLEYSGKKGLKVAFEKGYSELVSYYYTFKSIRDKFPINVVLLHKAVELKHVGVLDALLKIEPQSSENLNYLLYFSISISAFDIASILLEHGANLREPGNASYFHLFPENCLFSKTLSVEKRLMLFDFYVNHKIRYQPCVSFFIGKKLDEHFAEIILAYISKLKISQFSSDEILMMMNQGYHNEEILKLCLSHGYDPLMKDAKLICRLIEEGYSNLLSLVMSHCSWDKFTAHMFPFTDKALVSIAASFLKNSHIMMRKIAFDWVTILIENQEILLDSGLNHDVQVLRPSFYLDNDTPWLSANEYACYRKVISQYFVNSCEKPIVSLENAHGEIDNQSSNSFSQCLVDTIVDEFSDFSKHPEPFSVLYNQTCKNYQACQSHAIETFLDKFLSQRNPISSKAQCDEIWREMLTYVKSINVNRVSHEQELYQYLALLRKAYKTRVNVNTIVDFTHVPDSSSQAMSTEDDSTASIVESEYTSSLDSPRPVT